MYRKMRIVALLILSVVLASFAFAQNDTCGLIPEIPDANLVRAIKKQLKIIDFETVTCVELELLTKLNASRYKITSLQGLQFATNLKELMLSTNLIEDISPLAGLSKLRQLFISDNKLVKIGAIATMPNIEWLGLDDNFIDDVSALDPRALEMLKHVAIVGNCLDISNDETNASIAINSLLDAGVTLKYVPQNPFDKCSAKE